LPPTKILAGGEKSLIPFRSGVVFSDFSEKVKNLSQRKPARWFLCNFFCQQRKWRKRLLPKKVETMIADKKVLRSLLRNKNQRFLPKKTDKAACKVSF